MGFTLYDDENNIIYNRLVKTTYHNEQQDISVSSKISEIVFHANSDGYHGSFMVRDNKGSAKEFHCTNCMSNSTTLELKNVYIDTDMDADQNLPNTANCQNSCHFVSGELNRQLSLIYNFFFKFQNRISESNFRIEFQNRISESNFRIEFQNRISEVEIETPN